MTTPAPHHTQATFCATLVDEWARAGVAHAVVAPGSRSTPLALALAADDRLAVHVFHDERAASFAALGIGRATGVPAVVLTTSGTATAHLHAAAIEADLGAVPMLVCTADRPPELRHVGAPQTVDQQHLYGGAVRWFADPGVADEATRGSWRSLAARAVAEATTGAAGPGPVQLNLPFREPLVGEPGDLPAGRPDGAPWHGTAGRRRALTREGAEHLGRLLDADRGLIVAGAGAGDLAVVLELARSTGWPVLADPASGCRVDDPVVVGAFDLVLRHRPTAAALAPDVVLHLGGRPASKVLGRWLAEVDPVEVAVPGGGRWIDPDRRAAHVLDVEPAAACQALVHLVGGRPDAAGAWSAAWTAAEAAAQGALADALAAPAEPTEPGVARTLVAGLPAGAALVVSSSMPIRDVEWCSAPRRGLRVLANRGANGIDGVVSTAIGAALAGDGVPTAALVGDVAFLHDSTALIGAAARGIDLVVVVVDNDGGGIFSFLPQAGALGAERFEQLFGTPHGVDLAALAAAHGLPVAEPTGAADVATAVEAAIAAGGVQVVRVRTDRRANVAVHDEVVAAVAAALDGLG